MQRTLAETTAQEKQLYLQTFVKAVTDTSSDFQDFKPGILGN